MDEKIKTWLLRFPAQENPNAEKALFDWPIVLQYDVKAKYRLICRKFFGHEVFTRSYENRFKRFRVKDVSGETFQPVEISSAAVWTSPKTVEAFPFSPCLLNTANFFKTKMKSAHRKQNRRHYHPFLYLTLQ